MNLYAGCPVDAGGREYGRVPGQRPDALIGVAHHYRRKIGLHGLIVSLTQSGPKLARVGIYRAVCISNARRSRSQRNLL